MISIVIPRHLEQRIAHLIRKELDWHDKANPDVLEVFYGPLSDQKTTVLIGIPSLEVLEPAAPTKAA